MAIARTLRNILPWCQRVIFSLGICGHRWLVSFFLSMLHLAEKRAKRFRNVTRYFACLLLVSRTSQENVLLVIQISTCKWIRMRVFITLLSPKLCHKNMLCLHCMVNNVLLFVEWDKRQISEYTMYINPLSLSVHILRFSACRRGSDGTKHTEM